MAIVIDMPPMVEKDRVATFIYILLHDYMTAGDVSAVVDAVDGGELCLDKELRRYAEGLAGKLINGDSD